MRYFIPLLIPLAFSLTVYSQVDSAIQRVNASLRAERKKEMNSPERLWLGIYPEKGFEKYKGVITEMNDQWFSYDGTMMRLGNADTTLKTIFKLGLIYPSAFGGNTTGEIWKYEKLPDTLSGVSRLINHLIRMDSITISLWEIPQSKPDIRIKKFQVWLSHHRTMNPTEYFLDLDNKTATENMDMGAFIKGATLTYLRKGGIII